MAMKDCIFCKIAAKKIPSEIVYENSAHVSFLDISPTTEGMTVVIPKKHYDSDIYTNNEHVIADLMAAAKNTANILMKKLKPMRVLTRIEGLEIAHLHVKLFPFYGDRSPKDTTFDHIKPAPSKEDLKAVADKIRS